MTKQYGGFNRNFSPAKNKLYNGIMYRSKLEAGYAQMLDIRVKANDIKSWRYEPPLRVYINGVNVFTYKIDFELIHNDDSVELVECKGFETSIWRLKFKILEAILKPEVTTVDNLYIEGVQPGTELTIVK